MNTATANVTDDEANTDSESGSATVNFTDVLPAVEVDKSASPTSVPESGGPVTFTFTVTNTGLEAGTITSLTDSDFTLTGDADCKVGTVLAAGVSCDFTYTTTITGDFGGPDHENEFTAVLSDDDGNSDDDSDSATVTFSDVLPDITVTKTANPTAVPETGGSVTFTVSVKNNSTEAATLDSLTDSDFGDLDGEGTCVTGGSIAAGATYTCSFTRTVSGDFSGPDHSNTVTATVSDDDANSDTESGTATVDFTDVLPSITRHQDPEPDFGPGDRRLGHVHRGGHQLDRRVGHPRQPHRHGLRRPRRRGHLRDRRLDRRVRHLHVLIHQDRQWRLQRPGTPEHRDRGRLATTMATTPARRARPP